MSFDDFDKLFNNGDPGDGDEIGAINYLGKDEDAASRAGDVVSRYTDGEVHAEDLLNSFDMDFDFDNPRKITEDANNSPVYRGNSGPGTISFRFDNSHEEKERDNPRSEKKNDVPREEKKTDIRSEEKSFEIPQEEKKNDVPREEKKPDIRFEEKKHDIPLNEEKHDAPREEKHFGFSSDDKPLEFSYDKKQYEIPRDEKPYEFHRDEKQHDIPHEEKLYGLQDYDTGLAVPEFRFDNKEDASAGTGSAVSANEAAVSIADTVKGAAEKAKGRLKNFKEELAAKRARAEAEKAIAEAKAPPKPKPEPKPETKPEAKKPAAKKTTAKNVKKAPASVKSATKSTKKKTSGKASNNTASKAVNAVNKAVKKTVKKPAKKKPARRPKWQRYLLAAVKILLTLFIVGGIAGGAYVAYVIAKAPVIHPDKIYDTLDISTHIYDDKGDLIQDVYFSENREIANYDQFPDNLKNAFIAIEDKTFWEHHGYNITRMFGAVWNSLTGGGEISGTSTITQQLARNVFLPEEKSVRSIKRKIIEMYYAHEIEEQLSKEEILTAYFNTIYLGYGCYGVDTAAKKYFSCDVEDLTLEQCAALAALPQAPGVYALIVTEPDEYTTELGDGLYANDISADRRNIVLDLMAEQGYITQEEADAAKKPAAEFLKPSTENKNAKSAFKDFLLQTVKADLMEQYDLSDERAEDMIYTKGLHIYSTMDSQAQRVIVKEFKKKDGFPDALKKKSNVEAAMVITEVGTGQIKAMAGSRDASGDMLFNRATSPRQPGSSIKPLAVYAPALQKSFEYEAKGEKFKFTDTGYDRQGKNGWGNYITVASLVRDEKMKVNGKTWPQNFSRSYTGNNTFRTAIQQSINTCAVKILAQVGIEYSMDMVKKFGITTLVDDTSNPVNDYNLAALGLGAMTEGVTPLEMSLAYATFPNGGVRNSGICYTKVTDSDGNVLLEGKSTETQVLDEGVAWIMTDVLKKVVSRGIGFPAAVKGEEVGGKTGTTDEAWDIWFDGFTPKYSAALWIGTDDNAPLSTNSEAAAALWGKIMGQVKRAKGGEYKDKPDNITYRNGDYFTDGTEPPVIVKKKKEEKKDEKKEEGAEHSDTKEPDPKSN